MVLRFITDPFQISQKGITGEVEMLTGFAGGIHNTGFKKSGKNNRGSFSGIHSFLKTSFACGFIQQPPEHLLKAIKSVIHRFIKVWLLVTQFNGKN